MPPKITDKFLKAILRDLPTGSRVLDLGSGDGKFVPAKIAKSLGQMGYRVTAVDKKPGYKLPWKGVNYIQTSVEQYLVNFQNSYELILMRCILPFIARECVALATAHLNPGGILYALTFQPTDPVIPQRLLMPKAETQQLMQDAGLKEIITEEYTEKDNHPPLGKHEHHLMALVYRKPFI